MSVGFVWPCVLMFDHPFGSWERGGYCSKRNIYLFLCYQTRCLNFNQGAEITNTTGDFNTFVKIYLNDDSHVFFNILIANCA